MIVIPFDKFEEQYNQLKQSKQKCIVLFSSDKNQDGSYWCPDCQAIKPFYKTFLQQCEQNKLKLYCFIAGDRPTWKDQNNKFRKHLDILLTNVPTMGLFNGKKVEKKLLGQEIINTENRSLLYQE